MSCITIDSGTRVTDARTGGAERSGTIASLLGVMLGLVSACRSAAALAMMSERDLDDLGLLPWEVRSEDGSVEDRTASRQAAKLAHCNQA